MELRVGHRAVEFGLELVQGDVQRLRDELAAERAEMAGGVGQLGFGDWGGRDDDFLCLRRG
jgi:hypothetical protein